MFSIESRDPDSKARTGFIMTSHGEIPTPIFMPVGTVGTVKGVMQRDLSEDIDAKIILGNTYHLYLRPGQEILKAAGGLHKFMSWDRPMLTDSGGYQVFSLTGNMKLTEDGAVFKSHIDGSKHIFTPENTVNIQKVIGADIIMAFDECTPWPCDYSYVKKSTEQLQGSKKRIRSGIGISLSSRLYREEHTMTSGGNQLKKLHQQVWQEMR